jgi:hypothetical protein
MSRQVTKYRCLIISPSDVEAERQSVSDCIGSWNAHIGGLLGVHVEAVAWEVHALPVLGDRPQALFNPTVDNCDIGIAIFWTRLGTPTGTHRSGSVEEIARLKEAGKSVLVYFCNKDVPRANLDPAEMERLATFRDGLQQEGILQEFNSPEELAKLVALHLTAVMGRLSGVSNVVPDVQAGKLGQPTVLTAPIPDLRVRVGSCRQLVQRPRGAYPDTEPRSTIQWVYRVTVENHSPVPVFLGNIVLELQKSAADGAEGRFMPTELMHQSSSQRIEPGDSFPFVYDRDYLLKKVGPDRLRAAVVFDRVGRRYETAEGEAERALRGEAGQQGVALDDRSPSASARK